MSFMTDGIDTLTEVTNISHHGLWLIVRDTEYFLPFVEFPWFKDATVSQITNFELVHSSHLYWPQLDIDLSLSILENLERYPLLYKESKSHPR